MHVFYKWLWVDIRTWEVHVEYLDYVRTISFMIKRAHILAIPGWLALYINIRHACIFISNSNAVLSFFYLLYNITVSFKLDLSSDAKESGERRRRRRKSSERALCGLCGQWNEKVRRSHILLEESCLPAIAR